VQTNFAFRKSFTMVCRWTECDSNDDS